jgi:hypothetical protein
MKYHAYLTANQGINTFLFVTWLHNNPLLERMIDDPRLI